MKLVMSHGYSRNEAAELASEVYLYGSYASMYRLVQGFPSGVCKIHMDMAAVYDAMVRVYSSFAAFLRRVAGNG